MIFRRTSFKFLNSYTHN